MMIVFFGSRAELAKEIDRLASRRDFRCLWIVWRKKSSTTPSDLRQQDVRALGLAAGLVDYKICSVDPTHSALAFARRAFR